MGNSDTTNLRTNAISRNKTIKSGSDNKCTEHILNNQSNF